MAKLACEICGGDITKDGGVFLCGTCGCRYSLEEAKAMFARASGAGTGDTVLAPIPRQNEIAPNVQGTETVRPEQIKILEDAIHDGRYDFAIMQCNEILLRDPQDLLIIAIQGLATYGRAPLVDGVPAVAEKTVRRFLEDIEGYLPSALKRVKALRSIKKSASAICESKKQEAVKNIEVLEAQYRTAEASNAGLFEFTSLLSSIVGDDRSAARSARWAGQERIGEKIEAAQVKQNNARVEQAALQIENAYADIERFTENIGRGIDRKISQFESAAKEEQAARNEAYWERHAEEKEKLLAELAKLTAQVTANDAEIADLDRARRELREMKTELSVKYETVGAKIDALSAQLLSLGAFKTKEKKVLKEQIARLNEEMPSRDALDAAKEKLERTTAPQYDALREKTDAARNKASELKKRIKAIETELNADR